MKVYFVVKRILDFVLSLLTILVLWPLFILISLLIKVDTEGPIFFRQKRIGRNKKEFYILKFRTMSTNAPIDMPTHMLNSPDSYITRLGKLLRKTSLDELPQIINIIKGEMSIVGPRPALWNQFDLIAERDKYYVNDILPGLTGWAQINGRDELSIDIKAAFDGEYIKRMSLAFDLIIIIKTVFSVIRSEGIKEGTSTIENKAHI